MLLFLAAIYFMPMVILGRELSLHFWRSGWYLASIVFAVLAIIDIYFGVNYRVYTLLEKEDWPALIQELENKVLQKNNFSPRLVRLLINSYLVLSDVHSVTELGKRLAIAKKSLLDKNALSFCASRILCKDYEGAAAFLEPRCSGAYRHKGGDAEWQRWYFGFAQLLSRRFESAADAFLLLAEHGRESIPTGLSSYFLNENLASFLPQRSENLKQVAESAKERVKKRLRSRSDWDRDIKRMDTEVYLAVLQVYTDKAGNFLY
jgi:hypothetical protein